MGGSVVEFDLLLSGWARHSYRAVGEVWRGDTEVGFYRGSSVRGLDLHSPQGG
jgi:hypothetical protein